DTKMQSSRKTRAGSRSATGVFNVANRSRRHHLRIASVRGLAGPAAPSFRLPTRFFAVGLAVANVADIEGISTLRRPWSKCYYGRRKREAPRRSEPGRRQIRQDYPARCRGKGVSAATVGRGGGEDRKAARASAGQGGGVQISPRSQEDGQGRSHQGGKACIGVGPAWPNALSASSP